MTINLHDNGLHLRFAPLTLTRPLAELRIGMFTIRERWKMYFPEVELGYITEAYLSRKYAAIENASLEINASVIPSQSMIEAIQSLPDDSILTVGETWIARKGLGINSLDFKGDTPLILSQRWHLFQHNEAVLRQDFEQFTKGRKTSPLSKSNNLIGNPSHLFIEEGATVEAAVINVTSGPVYIGKNAEVMEGCLIRGPLALSQHACLKMGAKVYGATSIGPHCKVGGEVNNVVFFGYSNKGHDGFLGNAVVGEWCNLGADTNASNLKNTYGNIEVYSYETNSYVSSNEQFVGLCMGDHSKSGINTMFNTGTIVGTHCNIFGAEFPTKHIPSFSWGGASGFNTYQLERAIQHANNMMNRRGLALSDEDIAIFKHVFGKK